MFLISTTFVLQRRINHSLTAVERVVCDPHLFRAGRSFDLDTDGIRLTLEGPFGVTFPPFGVDGASWSAPATVRTRWWRRPVRLELEVNVWDAASTELLVRPRARRPWHWGARRLREYFHVAHLTADHLTQTLGIPRLAAAPERPLAPVAVTA